jgi:multiple sugar transport system ATP-binding protein
LEESALAEVRLSNITKMFGAQTAVATMDLTIQDGEFMVLVGPSGCGKTTTLRMIAGLEEISSGEVYIGDTLVNALPPRERDIAMVFQNYALYPHMTVFDNMGFALKMSKVPKAEIRERVTAAELLETGDEYVFPLS